MERGAPGEAVAAAPASPDREADRIFTRAVEAHRAGRVVEAVRRYAEALARDPAHVQALNNLGVLLRGQGRQAAAEACYRRALALAPGNAGLSHNLGNILRQRGALREALGHFLGAVESNPEDPALLGGLGEALADLGRYDEAAAAFRRALERQPAGDARGARRLERELALALLAAERYAEGFGALAALRREPAQELPAWGGESDPDGRLVILGEDGPGDCLFFLRWLPALAARGLDYRLALAPELAPELGPLAAGLPGCRSLLDARELGQLGAGAVLARLGALPHLLGLTEPPQMPEQGFLPVPAGPRPVPPPCPGRRLAVGLAWSGREGERGPGLERLLALAGRPGLQLLSLQKGSAVADLVTAGAAGLVHDMSPAFEGFADLARLLPGLDLVVAVEGPVAQLCGALGVPCWLLLPFAGDWRCPRGRATSPWYPRHRLFRQPRPGDWDGAVAALLAALDGRLAAGHG